MQNPPKAEWEQKIDAEANVFASIMHNSWTLTLNSTLRLLPEQTKENKAKQLDKLLDAIVRTLVNIAVHYLGSASVENETIIKNAIEFHFKKIREVKK